MTEPATLLESEMHTDDGVLLAPVLDTFKCAVCEAQPYLEPVSASSDGEKNTYTYGCPTAGCEVQLTVSVTRKS